MWNIFSFVFRLSTSKIGNNRNVVEHFHKVWVLKYNSKIYNRTFNAQFYRLYCSLVMHSQFIQNFNDSSNIEWFSKWMINCLFNENGVFPIEKFLNIQIITHSPCSDQSDRQRFRTKCNRNYINHRICYSRRIKWWMGNGHAQTMIKTPFFAS